MRVGIIGCGDISARYLQNAPLFTGFQFVACAARRIDRARTQADAFGLEALSVEALLARSDVDIVLNLTNPAAHADVTMAALRAGKHVYIEKPLAESFGQGQALLDAAASKGLRIGVAPDTILGPAVRTANHKIMQAAIGRPIFAVATAIGPGPERRHPDPAFLYQPGAGPLLDMAPYSLAVLTTLFGTVDRVCAIATVGECTRTIAAPTSPLLGTRFPVEVATTVQGMLHFENAFQATLLVSWDASGSTQPPLEIHGTDGTLSMPDPNWFGGTLNLTRKNGTAEPLHTGHLALGTPARLLSSGARVADYRGAGLAEMALAIRERRPHRCSATNALHVLEVLDAMARSAEYGGRWIDISSRHARFDPMDEAAAVALLAT